MKKHVVALVSAACALSLSVSLCPLARADAIIPGEEWEEDTWEDPEPETEPEPAPEPASDSEPQAYVVEESETDVEPSETGDQQEATPDETSPEETTNKMTEPPNEEQKVDNDKPEENRDIRPALAILAGAVAAISVAAVLLIIKLRKGASSTHGRHAR